MTIFDQITLERREDEQARINADEMERHLAIVRRTLTDTDVGDVAQEIGTQLLGLIRDKRDPALIGGALMAGLDAHSTRVAAYRAQLDRKHLPHPEAAVLKFLLLNSLEGK